MKKSNHIAERLARRARLSRADAAEQLEQMIHDILKDLKQGRSVPMPGLGTFEPGAEPTFRFESKPARKRS